MSSDLCGSSLILALPDEIFSVITSSLSPRDVCSLGISCPGLNAAVHPTKNLEVGNVEYAMPGFLSVVGCRIIPQEIGPSGLEDGPILWAPVFEIMCKSDGTTAFLLHGRERGIDYIYPGLLKSVDRNCNVLLLEVEPLHQLDGGNTSSDHEISQGMVKQKGTEISFSQMVANDRERLLDLVPRPRQVRDFVPYTANAILFPPMRNDEVGSRQDFIVLHERRLLLLQMHERALNPTEFGSSDAGVGDQVITQILRKSSSTNGGQENQSTLHEILRSGDRDELSLRAATMELDYYKAWPYMDERQSILYKLPTEPLKEWHEYAGLWGGTYGWPPRRLSEEKSGEALFLILISYEVLEGKQCMIATKILEGSSYVARPNGSAMFTMNICQPALESFPCDSDGDSDPIDSFRGVGIASGYGFRYPGSKPGSLFVLPNGLLVFIYEESRDVLTLQRFDLADLLRRGKRVPPLPPTSNFVYPSRMYTNPYTEFLDS
ncbi:PREDICTED: F-box protein At5g39450-like [Erythranthe guttata]|nr:PREDICTED: F-box protein At5g39450-like [Erythranthe guttata]|eukprot:XP_012851896.1 PREDICTED: F-box protein At5g39450-like [Erythranthe guttata]